MQGVPTLALTATATEAVQKDILRLLKIKKAKQFQARASHTLLPLTDRAPVPAQHALLASLVPSLGR